MNKFLKTIDENIERLNKEECELKKCWQKGWGKF